MKPQSVDCDVLVIGAGPSGLSAALNLASEGLSVSVFERSDVGGQMKFSTSLENVGGFNRPITGEKLRDRLYKQAKGFGAHFIQDEVTAIAKDCRHIQLSSGRTATCKSIVVASGLRPRRLENSEGMFGVFPAIAESELSKLHNLSIAIVGGGNSAGQATQYLSSIGAKLKLLARRPLSETMSAYLANRMPDSVVIGEIPALTQVSGKPCLGEECFDAVVAYLGSEPIDTFKLVTDSQGFIHTDSKYGCDGMPGVFAIGDVRSGSGKRVSSAIGEGSAVANRIHHYLSVASLR